MGIVPPSGDVRECGKLRFCGKGVKAVIGALVCCSIVVITSYSCSCSYSYSIILFFLYLFFIISYICYFVFLYFSLIFSSSVISLFIFRSPLCFLQSPFLLFIQKFSFFSSIFAAFTFRIFQILISFLSINFLVTFDWTIHKLVIFSPLGRAGKPCCAYSLSLTCMATTNWLSGKACVNLYICGLITGQSFLGWGKWFTISENHHPLLHNNMFSRQKFGTTDENVSCLTLYTQRVLAAAHTD